MAIWKSIKGYDNQYWVSDEGQVMSLKNKGKLLKPILKYKYLLKCFENKFLFCIFTIGEKSPK